MSKQRGRIEEVKYEGLKEVSFENFEKTMRKLVKAKPPKETTKKAKIKK